MKAFLILTLSCLMFSVAAAKAADRPNFLIILIDDMGYGDPSSYGNMSVQTPHIDQLAEDGTRFTSFYAQSVCGPSRGALMTGRYPNRVGGGWTTNAQEVFISEILQEAGYATGAVGKWDMSGRRYQEALVPNSQGFDWYFGTLGANDENQITLYENREKLETTSDMAGLSRLFTNKSIEFLEEQQDNEKPFFLYLAHTMMHVVIDATPRFRGITGKGIYADTLVELDHEIGRLLARLDQLGLRESTLVLLASDNGPWSNDHVRQRDKNGAFVPWTKGPKTPWGTSGSLRGAKASTWEGGIRVPGIIRWPGKVPASRTSDAIISTLDVLPTFATLAGVASKIPSDRKIDGINQTLLLRGEDEKGARSGFLFFESGELQAVREGPWKLRLPDLKKIRNWPEIDRGSGETELYNLERDLGESTNVAADYPEIVEHLMTIAGEALVEF